MEQRESTEDGKMCEAWWNCPGCRSLQYFGPLMQSRLIGKDPDAGKALGKEERVTEDEMVRWHHWLNGHESEQTPGDSEGPGSLASCSPQGLRVGHDLATEQQQAYML